MDDIGPTRTAAPEGQSQEGGQPWTLTSGVLAALALISALVMIAIHASFGTHSASLAEPWGGNILLFVLVFALIATGFRWVGDIVAIPVALFFGIPSGLATMLTLLPLFALFTILQAITIIVAITDLLSSREGGFAAMPLNRRLIGLGVSVAVGAYLYHRLGEPVKTEAARRARLTPAQRSAEVGYDVNAPRETDSTFAPGIDWIDWDPRL